MVSSRFSRNISVLWLNELLLLLLPSLMAIELVAIVKNLNFTHSKLQSINLLSPKSQAGPTTWFTIRNRTFCYFVVRCLRSHRLSWNSSKRSKTDRQPYQQSSQLQQSNCNNQTVTIKLQRWNRRYPLPIKLHFSDLKPCFLLRSRHPSFPYSWPLCTVHEAHFFPPAEAHVRLFWDTLRD